MDRHYTMMSKDERKLYASIENVVNYINSNSIALPTKEKHRNNIILNEIRNQIIEKMKQTNPLFGALFKAEYYGGSYYDQLKVTKPNEYDLDLILSLPQMLDPALVCSNRPGFVMVKLENYSKISDMPPEEQAKFKELKSLLTSEVFLSTTKVQSWFEGVLAKLFNTFQKEGKKFYLETSLSLQNPEEVIKIYIKPIKGGPAITLQITGTEIDGSDIQLDIDLVPCFWFDGNQHWPANCRRYRSDTFSDKSSFLVVPKKPKDEVTNKSLLERYWRMSFQEQERDLISNKKALKPSLKILKKLRDTYEHEIPSYFIKTIYLWTVDEEHENFWSQPVMFVIITMLEKYKKHLDEGIISYYWNEKYNLLEYKKKCYTQEIAKQLHKIISGIKIGLRDPIDPYVIGKSLLTAEQFTALKLAVPLSKYQKKKIQNAITNKKLNNSHYSTDLPDSATPLILLEFSLSDLTRTQKYLETYERLNSPDKKMSQLREKTSENSEDNEVVAYLKKIDEKLDKILNRIEESLEEGKNMCLRLERLEEAITALEINNMRLKGQSSSSESIEE